MGCNNVMAMDFDRVETVNRGSQLYGISHVGRPKVEALASILLDHGLEIEAVNEKYTPGMILPGIVIVAVDSMEVRKQVWETHKDSAIRTRYIIDPRMGAESAQLYVRNPMDAKDFDYDNSLYSDESAVQERCAAKATAYTALLLSGLVAKAVKDLITGRPDHIRTAQWNIASNAFMAWRKGAE
jgi:hypothetical protein